jgi:hypothetical protein
MRHKNESMGACTTTLLKLPKKEMKATRTHTAVRFVWPMSMGRFESEFEFEEGS